MHIPIAGDIYFATQPIDNARARYPIASPLALHLHTWPTPLCEVLLYAHSDVFPAMPSPNWKAFFCSVVFGKELLWEGRQIKNCKRLDFYSFFLYFHDILTTYHNLLIQTYSFIFMHRNNSCGSIWFRLIVSLSGLQHISGSLFYHIIHITDFIYIHHICTCIKIVSQLNLEYLIWWRTCKIYYSSTKY